MDLDVRMKAYEQAFRYSLPVRMPVVIRLDGKAFHNLTRNCERPFDGVFRDCMVRATKATLGEMMNARLAYCQSDEVSILLVDYNKLDSEQWFSGIVQKIVSVSASAMTAHFNHLWDGDLGLFDSRVFVIPERDIVNYFLWRQRDCMKNAVTMAAQSVFSDRELHGKHSGEKVNMLNQKGIKFDDYPTWFRFGTVVTRDEINSEPPIFGKHRDFFEKFLTVEEE